MARNDVTERGARTGREATEHLVPSETPNIGSGERWATGLGGAALALYGLARPLTLRGLTALGLGGGLLGRAVRGRSRAYERLGREATGRSRPIRSEQVTTILRPAGELYEAWRRLEDLPRWVHELERVEQLGDGRSRWTARAPGGKHVQWEAEIVDDVPGYRLAWRSVPGSQLETNGQITFEPAPGEWGTEVRLRMEYVAPGGLAGAMAATLSGHGPEQALGAALRRFKQWNEAGEIATTEGQPAGPGHPSREPGLGLRNLADAITVARNQAPRSHRRASKRAQRQMRREERTSARSEVPVQVQF